MSMSDPAARTISQAGYRLYDICKCNGKLTYKYKLPKSAREIWSYPETRTYSFVAGGRLMGGGTHAGLNSQVIERFKI